MKNVVAAHPRRRSRGFATLMAFGLIGILAVTLAAMAVTFAADVRRSARHAEDAQLRQLLLAAEPYARASLAAAAGPTTIDLPADLATAGVKLAYERVAPDADGAGVVCVRVTATGTSGRSMTQTLTYARTADRWELRAAEL